MIVVAASSRSDTHMASVLAKGPGELLIIDLSRWSYFLRVSRSPNLFVSDL